MIAMGGTLRTFDAKFSIGLSYYESSTVGLFVLFVAMIHFSRSVKNQLADYVANTKI